IDAAAVVSTVSRLRDRVLERLPGSGLSKVAQELDEVARSAAQRAADSARPLLGLRLAAAVVLLVLLAGLVFGITSLRLSTSVQSLAELVQALESLINDVVFLGIGLVFLVGLEGRIKRRRVLAALHELRSLAHIIDMHQLTKDPDRLTDAAREGASDTPSSPTRTLTRFELGRYLDYCSEMLALLGKIAALYAQSTSDPVALGAVDEIEALTSGLSHKIWQKIMILHQQA
ncbi:MAG TPA: hypothetical protein VFZ61_23975, partial [Polyangiales bacterium]